MNEKSTLLVVDDDKDLLRQLEFLLEDDFGKILISPSKEKALELAKEKIDVCLIDVRLSENDTGKTQGLEVAGELRKIHPSIIFVMMSRYDFEKYESLTQKESQADAFIRKPFIMDDFVQLVNKIKEARNAGTTSH